MHSLHRGLFKLLFVFLIAAPFPAQAQDFSLSAYKGHVVYLDFWASWCTPCRLSFPWMNQLQREYAAKGLVVVAVDVDHDRALANQFLQQTPAQFKIVYDPNGQIAQKYGVTDMPTSFVIGRDGKVQYVHSGFTQGREGEYEAHVMSLLAGGD